MPHSLCTQQLFAVGFVLALVTGSPLHAEAPPVPEQRIGFTELRTNLPGGRHANVRTMRAVVVKGDGTDRSVLAAELTREADTWTQFAGWSPDGKTVIVGRGCELGILVRTGTGTKAEAFRYGVALRQPAAWAPRSHEK